MIRLILAAFLFCVALSAHAQKATVVNSCGAPVLMGQHDRLTMNMSGWLCVVGLAGTAGYVGGPGDIAPGATGWWGLRAYSSAIAAAGLQNIANLRNAVTAEQCNVLPAISGGLGLTAGCTGSSNGVSVAAFCGGATCYVTKLYDQSGNGRDAVQATAANQPVLTPNFIGNLPCVRYNIANTNILKATIPALSQPTSYSFVFNIVTSNNSGGTQSIMSGFSAGGQQQIYYNSNSQIVAYAGSFLTGTNAGLLNTNYAVGVLLNGAASEIDIGGISVSGAAGAGATSTSMGLGGRPNGALVYSDMYMCESGVWPTDISASFNALTNNQHAYWGF